MKTFIATKEGYNWTKRPLPPIVDELKNSAGPIYPAHAWIC